MNIYAIKCIFSRVLFRSCPFDILELEGDDQAGRLYVQSDTQKATSLHHTIVRMQCSYIFVGRLFFIRFSDGSNSCVMGLLNLFKRILTISYFF